LENYVTLQRIGAEVYEVLQNVSEESYKKVPKNIIAIFEKYKDNDFNVKIDCSKKFEEQEISKQAKDIIFAISLNYWLTDEERESVINKLNETERKLLEKYSIQNIFEEEQNRKNKKIENVMEEKAIVKYEEKWYTKILKKIKNFFGKV